MSDRLQILEDYIEQLAALQPINPLAVESDRESAKELLTHVIETLNMVGGDGSDSGGGTMTHDELVAIREILLPEFDPIHAAAKELLEKTRVRRTSESFDEFVRKFVKSMTEAMDTKKPHNG